LPWTDLLSALKGKSFRIYSGLHLSSAGQSVRDPPILKKAFFSMLISFLSSPPFRARLSVVMNPEINLNATFSPFMPRKGRIAFLSQSGAFILAVTLWAQKTKFGFSKIVSMGNKAILDEADFLEYFAEDERTDVIMLYIEGVQNGKRFMEISKKVGKDKPIVVLKAGKTESGARAASSHTGSLAGSYEVYKTAFEQCGIVTAENAEELFDFSFALSKYRKIGKVAIITNSGGPGVMASDAVEIYGLELSNFSIET